MFTSENVVPSPRDRALPLPPLPPIALFPTRLPHGFPGGEGGEREYGGERGRERCRERWILKKDGRERLGRAEPRAEFGVATRGVARRSVARRNPSHLSLGQR